MVNRRFVWSHSHEVQLVSHSLKRHRQVFVSGLRPFQLLRQGRVETLLLDELVRHGLAALHGRLQRSGVGDGDVGDEQLTDITRARNIFAPRHNTQTEVEKTICSAAQLANRIVELSSLPVSTLHE